MWRMPGGDRVLNDAEWRLFADGLDELRDAVESDIEHKSDDSRLDVPAFDDLTPEQKLVLLADVALSLRDRAVPTPHHTATSEGAIAAVFAMIGVSLDMELDQARDDEGDKPTDVRRAETTSRLRQTTPGMTTRGAWGRRRSRIPCPAANPAVVSLGAIPLSVARQTIQGRPSTCVKAGGPAFSSRPSSPPSPRSC